VKELLEYVNEQTVVLRHPEFESTIHRFFADAGDNAVQAFSSETQAGYIFRVMSSEDTGRYFQLVTFDMNIGEVSEEKESRFSRQFTHGEWYTGTFRGRLGHVAAMDLAEE
jgi:hypothetical protein